MESFKEVSFQNVGALSYTLNCSNMHASACADLAKTKVNLATYVILLLSIFVMKIKHQK